VQWRNIPSHHLRPIISVWNESERRFRQLKHAIGNVDQTHPCFPHLPAVFVTDLHRSHNRKNRKLPVLPYVIAKSLNLSQHLLDVLGLELAFNLHQIYRFYTVSCLAPGIDLQHANFFPPVKFFPLLVVGVEMLIQNPSYRRFGKRLCNFPKTCCRNHRCPCCGELKIQSILLYVADFPAKPVDVFLRYIASLRAADLQSLTLSDVNCYISNECARYQPATVKAQVTANCNFFRYLYRCGDIASDISTGIFTVRNHRQVGLPKALERHRRSRRQFGDSIGDNTDRNRNVTQRVVVVRVIEAQVAATLAQRVKYEAELITFCPTKDSKTADS